MHVRIALDADSHCRPALARHRRRERGDLEVVLHVDREGIDDSRHETPSGAGNGLFLDAGDYSPRPAGGASMGAQTSALPTDFGHRATFSRTPYALTPHALIP